MREIQVTKDRRKKCADLAHQLELAFKKLEFAQIEGWCDDLKRLDEDDEFCIQHNGTPLLNQTPGITPLQAQAAFGSEIETFLDYRRKHDPEDRFYIDFFRNLFEVA